MADFFKKIESGSLTSDLIVKDNMKQILPEVDLDDAAAVLAAGYVQFNFEQKPEDPSNYKKEWVSGDDTEVSSGIWKNNWSLADRTMSADEEADAVLRGMNDMRLERNKRLAITDHYALQDTAAMSSEMTTYRQALRDLPASVSDPFDITWPTPPSGTPIEWPQK